MFGQALRELAAPNLRLITAYRREHLRPDLVAGISVAAVQIPTAIAYAQLVGFPPVVGLYASILPCVMYAIFGSSRQLMVGPDAATCAMVAAALLGFGASDPTRYLELSMALAILVGVFCVVAGFFRAGFMANYLSQPILIGFMTGMGLTIIGGQLGKVFGVKILSTDFFPRVAEVASKLPHTHWPTAAFSFALLALFLALRRLVPRLPIPLAGIAVGIAAVIAFNLGGAGISLLGVMPPGSLHLAIPGSLSWNDWTALVPEAAGVAFLAFCSAVATGRSFAAKNGYSINANRDFVALGLANIASGVTQGFCVSGADSRTAINDLAKGRTQMVGIVSALVTAIVLLFFTAPLAFIPNCALGMVLIFAGMGLIDVRSMFRLRRAHVLEFWVSVVAALGVLVFGVLPGLGIAILLSLMILLYFTSHPQDAVLGVVPGLDGYNDIAGRADARTVPGTLIYRFHAPLAFYNVDTFVSRLRALVDTTPRHIEFVLFDAGAAWGIDSTAAVALRQLVVDLRGRGIRFGVARSQGMFQTMLERTGLRDEIGADNVFVSIRSAINAWQPRTDQEPGNPGSHDLSP